MSKVIKNFPLSVLWYVEKPPGWVSQFAQSGKISLCAVIPVSSEVLNTGTMVHNKADELGLKPPPGLSANGDVWTCYQAYTRRSDFLLGFSGLPGNLGFFLKSEFDRIVIKRRSIF